MENKKLDTAIEEHNALVDPLLKIVCIEDVLEIDYVFPWQVSRQGTWYTTGYLLTYKYTVMICFFFAQFRLCQSLNKEEGF